jgi:acyl-coenzyme A thioesterase PaaI-like protein
VTLHPGFTDSFTNHLGYESERTSDLEASSWIECRPDLLDEGNLHTAVVGYLIDSTAGVVCGTAAVPNWVVTADLQFRIASHETVGPVRADARAVRPGRRQSIGAVRVVDEGAAERVVAVGTVNHLVIALDADLDVPADMPIGLRYGPANPLTGPPAQFARHFGLRQPGPGRAELDVVGDAVNPLGILHGGLLSLLASAAATSLALDQEATRVADMVLRFIGPLPRDRTATATAEVIVDRAGALAVSVAIADPSDAAGRIATLASVGLTTS